MLSNYARLVDRLIPPKVEKIFRLGRRYTGDRRLQDEDRRNNAEENFRYSQSERRDSHSTRRSTRVDDRRRRWFRINAFQSRHFSWSPGDEQSERSDGSS